MPATRGRPRWARRGSLSTLLLLGLIGAASLQLPVAGARGAPTVTSVSWGSPYPSAGGFVAAVHRIQAGCGANTTVSIAPDFNTSRGDAEVAASTLVRVCSSSNATAAYAGDIGVRYLNFTANGSSNVSVRTWWGVYALWKVTVRTNGSPASSALQARLGLSLHLALRDLHTGTTVVTAGLGFRHPAVTNGSAGGGGLISCSAHHACWPYLNSSGVALVPGRHYEVRVWIHFLLEARAGAGAPVGGLASASISMIPTSPNRVGYLFSVTVR